jgi:hypothetical protein
MPLDDWRELEELYKKAQKIFMHELTEDEQVFIAQLAFDNRATLPEAKFRRLRDLVKRKGHLSGSRAEK